ncbi:TonB-dependent hemoglobin/transferrin/lactoferrin family receptor [Vibrio sinaloensis]|uniref:TonB-dependent hemoglobin/transferrin/lactoferrin family receptor n=1 Tax=Photobacterium sp. (strain ATCC 43367) TaxID=379097 RepID=UPI00057F8370|nr:TonB-dependent hemoglobin/transferrin/lactoferrin family receptor [Vibrio sinaloensis]KHT48225.1 ligand-gated channel [Vibrio sinaloensis]
MKLSRVNVAVLTALAAGLVHAESNVSTFEEVVVTANKYEESLSKTAGSVSVIDGEEMRKKGATELYEVLKNEPGVSVTGSAGTAQNITIRGMSGNRVSVVKDGISTSDGYGANDLNDVMGHNSFDVSSAKEIQVVKGASSTSFGSGALGGVIIVKSLSPEDLLDGEDFYVDGAANYSDNSGRYRLSSNLAFALGDTSSLVQAAYWSGEESKSYDENLWNREIEGLSAAYTIQHYLNDEWMLKAKADFYREQMIREEGIAPPQRDAKMDIETFYEDETLSNYLFWLGAEYESETLLLDTLETKVYYRHTLFNEDSNKLMYRDSNGVRLLRREIENRQFQDQLVGWSADMMKELYQGELKHTLVYGGKFETTYHERPVDERLTDWHGVKVTQTNPFAPATSYSVGAFIQDSIEVGNWRAMLGLRYDSYRLSSGSGRSIGMEDLPDNNSSEVSPSASIAYQFTPAFNSYFSYKHGYRAPEYSKTYGLVNHDFVQGSAFIIMPNFELEEETSDSFEIGAKYDDGNMRVYGAVFYNVFRNFIEQKTIGKRAGTNITEVTFDNLDGVRTYGAEASVEYSLTNTIIASTNIGIVDGKDKEGDYVRAITPLEGNVALNYDNGALNGYVQLNWADQMNRTSVCVNEQKIAVDCATTAGWGAVDIGLGYDFGDNTNISVNVINLFDREYIRYQDIAGLESLHEAFQTESGRYFTVNARYAF